MAFDENVYELRRQKLKQIEALGQAAYRSKYDFTHTIPQILAEYSEKTAEATGDSPRQCARGRTHHGNPLNGQGGILAICNRKASGCRFT